MCLNARQVFYEVGLHTNILLSIEDITGRHALEREKEELLQQKGVLLEEFSIVSLIAFKLSQPSFC